MHSFELTRLPAELQTRIWKTYVRTHVLPEVAGSRCVLPLRALVRDLRERGNDPHHVDAILKRWADLVAGRFSSLEDAYDHLRRVFPETISGGEHDGDPNALRWTFEEVHVFTANFHWCKDVLVTYHGPATGTEFGTGIQCFAFRGPGEARSVTLGRIVTA